MSDHNQTTLNPCRRPAQCTDHGFGPETCEYCNPKTTDEMGVTQEFKALMDAIIAAGHTCQSVLRRVDARIAVTPLGVGRDNLVSFREKLIEKIQNG